MTLVPGSLQIDIFVTNIPTDPKPMPSAGTDLERQTTPRPRLEPQRRSWTPGKHPATLHAPQMSQPSTSMEDVHLGTSDPAAPIHLAPVEEKSRRRVSQVSLSDDYNALLVYNPNPGSSGGSYGDGGLTGTSYEYEMGLGAGGHYLEDSTYDVLDYTHFNGDLDMEVAPAEDLFSRRLRKEGAIRRRKTRRLAMGYPNESWVDLGQQPEVASPTSEIDGGFSPLSSLHGHGDERGDDYSQFLTLGPGEPALTRKQARRVSIPAYLQQYEFDQRDPSKPRDKKADRASVSSIRESVVDLPMVQSMMPKTGKGARGEEAEIQFSEEELEDVLAMAEYAWPGRPMLDKLLQEEVDKANGAIVVACE